MLRIVIALGYGGEGYAAEEKMLLEGNSLRGYSGFTRGLARRNQLKNEMRVFLTSASYR